MIGLSTFEVNKNGTVLAVTPEETSLIKDLFPNVNGNITTHWDESINEIVKRHLDEIFKSTISNEFTMIINYLPLQFTAHRFTPDSVFLFVKLIEQSSSENLQDIIDKKNEASRLKLLDFPFQDSSTPILYVYQDGSLYDFNEAFCKLFGYSVDDAKSFNLSDWHLAYLPDSWEMTWEKLKREGVISFTSKRSKKDGTTIDVEIRAHYIKFGDLELNCATITDITELKKEEMKLKLADFSFKNVFSPIAFIREDGSFFYFNEATSTLFGHTEKDFSSLTVFDINHTYNREQWQEQWDEIRQDIKLTLFSKFKMRDGSLIDVEVRTNRISFGDLELNCTFYTDITEKKKIEEQLKLVDFTFRNATTAIQLIKDDNTIYDFNEAMPFMLGYTKEEYKHIELLDLDPYRNKAGWATLWNNLKSTKSLVLQRKLKQKNGRLIEVEMHINQIKYGDIELNCAFITDVTDSKKTLEKLKLVDFAFKNASTAIFFIKEDGTFYDYNLSALSLCGYTKEEMKSLQVFNVDPNATPEARKGFWEDLRTAKSSQSIRAVQRKDGSWIDIEVKSNIVNFGGDVYNCAFISDITDKKRIEEHLNLVDFSFQNASTAILLVKEDGTFYDFNLATLDLFGYTNDEMKVLHVSDIDPDADNEIRKMIWDTIRVTGYMFHHRQMRRKDGTWLNLEVKANLIIKGGLELNLAFLTDITERKKLEERLKLLEKVVTETNQSVVISDASIGMDNAIIYSNDAFTRITGYSDEEVKGKNPRFLHIDINVKDDEGRNVMRNAIKNFVPWKTEIMNTKKNGEHYWADISGFPVFDNGKGEYTHWVAIQTDITKRKVDELERKQLIKQLTKHNHELQQFSFITTHNLRAPLTNLLSICKLIKTDTITDNRTLKLIEGFKTSTHELNDTLNDLIRILIIKEDSKLETNNIAVDEWLNKAKESIRIKLMQVDTIIEENFLEAPIINFNCIYLENIFINLLTNSIKYRHPDRKPIIKITTEKSVDGSTKLTFSDNGIGMNMEYIKGKIFGLHQRFHSNFEGKGMGLYLIHTQITALGGTIDVESEENVGTTFIIHFK